MVIIYYKDIKEKLPVFCIYGVNTRLFVSNVIQVRFALFWTLCLVAKRRSACFQTSTPVSPWVLPLICQVPNGVMAHSRWKDITRF